MRVCAGGERGWGMYVSAIMIKVFPLRELAGVSWMAGQRGGVHRAQERVRRVHCRVLKRDKEHVAQK